jgi:multiple sugar transport system ATP-binding protein
MADRVAVMIGGELLQLAPPQVIYDDPQHIEVAKFVGQPRINLLSSHVSGSNGTVALGDMRFVLTETSLSGGAPVTLAIRSEFVRVSQNADGGLPASVSRIEFLGSEVIVYCRLDAIGETMIAKVTPAEGASLKAGMPVRLHADPEHVFVFGADGRRIAALPLMAASAETREAAHG